MNTTKAGTIAVICAYYWRDPVERRSVDTSCVVHVKTSRDILRTFRARMTELGRPDGVMTSYYTQNNRATF